MTDDQKSLMQELVDAPYGKARDILREKGLWDEHAGDAGELRTYRMRVRGEMVVSAIVKVEARSAEEAEELALSQASAWDFQWRDYGDVDCVEAEVEDA